MNEVPLGWQLLLQVVLILLNAVFACAEIAIISINDNKVAKLAAQGDKRAVRLARLTSQPARFLSTIQIAITLAGFLGSAFAADNFAARIVDWLVSLGATLSRQTLNTLSVVLVTLILSYFTLVLGELVPKRLAMKRAEQLALGLSGFINGVAIIFRPIVSFLTLSTNAILRLLGVDPNAADDEVTEEEIRMMVDEGSEKGAIEPSEKEWIQNIFEFDDITAGEICTHRTDVATLWMDDPAEKWDETIFENRHSLYPICDETVDNIVGILSIKDYFRLKDHTRDIVLQKAVTPAYFVPESIKADNLFRSMRESRNHFAVVLDEYGGVTGIITMNDLLEQLVGDLNDEGTEPPIPEILPIEENCWQILGTTSLDDVEDELKVALPTDEYDTFGGFVMGTYGAIPVNGEQIEVNFENLQIRDIVVQDRRVEKAIVILLPVKTDEEVNDQKETKKKRRAEILPEAGNASQARRFLVSK